MTDSATMAALMDKFLVGLLVFTRITGFFVSAPLFKSPAITTQVKIFLGFILAGYITSAMWQEQPHIDFHLWNLVFLTLKEALAGLLLGYATSIVFFAARFGGALIDTDMGFQTGALFDRDSANPTLVGELFELIALMVFLALDGHLQLVESIFISVRALPLNTFVLSEATLAQLVKLLTSFMILGIKIASPALIALFLTNLALTLLARVAPQTNIFMLSFQLKTAVGLTVLMLSTGVLVLVLRYALQSVQQQTLGILLTLNPANVIK
ncbi:MAG: flagellar biosynthetic protein FliR [Chloroflexota bacterium]